HHRDLHSFPTRRSSDLGSRPTTAKQTYIERAAVIAANYRNRVARARQHKVGLLQIDIAVRDVDRSPNPLVTGCLSSILLNTETRSEEHTSELQSRGHLV